MGDRSRTRRVGPRDRGDGSAPPAGRVRAGDPAAHPVPRQRIRCLCVCGQRSVGLGGRDTHTYTHRGTDSARVAGAATSPSAADVDDRMTLPWCVSVDENQRSKREGGRIQTTYFRLTRGVFGRKPKTTPPTLDRIHRCHVHTAQDPSVVAFHCQPDPRTGHGSVPLPIGCDSVHFLLGCVVGLLDQAVCRRPSQRAWGRTHLRVCAGRSHQQPDGHTAGLPPSVHPSLCSTRKWRSWSGTGMGPRS